MSTLNPFTYFTTIEQITLLQSFLTFLKIPPIFVLVFWVCFLLAASDNFCVSWWSAVCIHVASKYAYVHFFLSCDRASQIFEERHQKVCQHLPSSWHNWKTMPFLLTLDFFRICSPSRNCSINPCAICNLFHSCSLLLTLFCRCCRWSAYHTLGFTMHLHYHSLLAEVVLVV